jgi:hypothetical protein
MQHPAYQQSHELALSRGWSIESRAGHPQASAPLPGACLALVEHHDWTPERMAQIWGQPLAQVRTALDTLSMEPLPASVRRVPRLPTTKEQAKVQRDIIRLRYQQGWSVERLAEHYFYYAVEVVRRIVSQPLEIERGKALRRGVAAAQAGKPLCGCGCGVTVRANQKWASPGCKKRVQRRS